MKKKWKNSGLARDTATNHGRADERGTAPGRSTGAGAATAPSRAASGCRSPAPRRAAPGRSAPCSARTAPGWPTPHASRCWFSRWLAPACCASRKAYSPSPMKKADAHVEGVHVPHAHVEQAAGQHQCAVQPGLRAEQAAPGEIGHQNAEKAGQRGPQPGSPVMLAEQAYRPSPWPSIAAPVFRSI